MPKASLEFEANPEHKASPSLDKINPSQDNIFPNLGIKIHLKSESWVKNKENYSSDQDKNLKKKSTFLKIFNIGDITKL